jgi:hypothetical protein
MAVSAADAKACGDGEFRCPFPDTDHCISASQRCNGVQDCTYGHDKRDCGKNVVCLFRTLINVCRNKTSFSIRKTVFGIQK